MAFNFQWTKSFEQEPKLEQNTLDLVAALQPCFKLCSLRYNMHLGKTNLFFVL